MSRILLLDIDGVVLDWSAGFDQHMKEAFGIEPTEPPAYTRQSYTSFSRYPGVQDIKERVREFNDSYPVFEVLHPDTGHYLTEFKKMGWKMFSVTSYSHCALAKQHRIDSLDQHFGGIFDGHNILGLFEEKEQALLRYRLAHPKSSIAWVEDSVENAEAGVRVGLDHVFLVDHPYNRIDHSSSAVRVEHIGKVSEHLKDT